MIDFNCPYCGRDIHAPDQAAGQTGTCKSCGEAIVVPLISGLYQPASISPTGTSIGKSPLQIGIHAPVKVSVQNPRPESNSLGLSAIILGIVAFCSCWISLIGWIAFPLALLGFIMGVIALMKGGDGVGFALAGTALCVVPLAVFAISAAFYASIYIAAEREAAEKAARIAQDEREAERDEKRQQAREKALAERARRRKPKVGPVAVRNAANPEQKGVIVIDDDEPVRIPLPKYVAVKSPDPLDKFYVRAAIDPVSRTKEEVIQIAGNILADQEQTEGVVDFFETEVPLTWSGKMAISTDAEKRLWLCRVTVGDDGLSAFEFGIGDNGQRRIDAVKRE